MQISQFDDKILVFVLIFKLGKDGQIPRSDGIIVLLQCLLLLRNLRGDNFAFNLDLQLCDEVLLVDWEAIHAFERALSLWVDVGHLDARVGSVATKLSLDVHACQWNYRFLIVLILAIELELVKFGKPAGVHESVLGDVVTNSWRVLARNYYVSI